MTKEKDIKEKDTKPSVKKFERNTIIFNSPYRSRVLYLPVNGVKEPFRFHNHTIEIIATDEERIKAVLDYIEVEKSLGEQTVFERNDYELLKASEPQDVTMEINGEKLIVPMSELKGDWLEKYKASLAQDTGTDQRIIHGTKHTTS